MLAAADEASGLLKALANRHRLIIICQLIEQERSVGELAALLENPRLDRVPASGAVAQRRAGHRSAGRTNDLVFDRQPAGAGTRTYAVSALLPADCGVRSKDQAQTGGAAP